MIEIETFVNNTQNLNHTQAQPHIEVLYNSLPKSFEDTVLLNKIRGQAEGISYFEQLVCYFETRIKRSKHSGNSVAAVTEETVDPSESKAWEASFSELRKKIGIRFYYKLKNCEKNQTKIQEDFAGFLFFYQKSAHLCPDLIEEELKTVGDKKFSLFDIIFLTIDKLSSVEKEPLLSTLWSAIFFPVQQYTQIATGQVVQFAQDFLAQLDLTSLFFLYSGDSSFKRVFDLIEDAELSHSYFVTQFSKRLDWTKFFDTENSSGRKQFLTLFHSERFDRRDFSLQIKRILFDRILCSIHFAHKGRGKGNLKNGLCYLLILDTEFFLQWCRVARFKARKDATAATIKPADTFEDISKKELLDVITQNPLNIARLLECCKRIIEDDNKEVIKSAEHRHYSNEKLSLGEVFLSIIGDKFKSSNIKENMGSFLCFVQYSRSWREKRNSEIISEIHRSAIDRLFFQYECEISKENNALKISLLELVSSIECLYNEIPKPQQYYTRKRFMHVLDGVLPLKKDKQHEADAVSALVRKMLNIKDRNAPDVCSREEISLFQALSTVEALSTKGLSHHKLAQLLIDWILQTIGENLKSRSLEKVACVFKGEFFKKYLFGYIDSADFFDPLCAYLCREQRHIFEAYVNYVFEKTIDQASYSGNHYMNRRLLLLYVLDPGIFFESLRIQTSENIARILNSFISTYFGKKSDSNKTRADQWRESVLFIKDLNQKILVFADANKKAISSEGLVEISESMASNLASAIVFENFDEITLLAQEIPWVLEQPTRKIGYLGRKTAEYFALSSIKKSLRLSLTADYDTLIEKVLKPIYRNAVEQETKQSVLLAILQGFELHVDKQSVDAVPLKLCWFLAVALNELPFVKNGKTLNSEEKKLLKSCQALRLGENKNFDKCGVFLRLQDQQDKTETKTWLTHIMDRPRNPGSLKSTVGTMIEKAKKQQLKLEKTQSVEVTAPEVSVVKEPQLEAEKSAVLVNATVFEISLDTPIPDISQINKVFDETMNPPRKRSSILGFLVPKRQSIPTAVAEEIVEDDGDTDYTKETVHHHSIDEYNENSEESQQEISSQSLTQAEDRNNFTPQEKHTASAGNAVTHPTSSPSKWGILYEKYGEEDLQLTQGTTVNSIVPVSAIPSSTDPGGHQEELLAEIFASIPEIERRETKQVAEEKLNDQWSKAVP